MHRPPLRVLWVSDRANGFLASADAAEVRKRNLVLERARPSTLTTEEPVRNGFDACVIDCNGRHGEELGILSRILPRVQGAPIILLVNEDSADLQDQAARIGAWGCVSRQQLTLSRLEETIHDAIAKPPPGNGRRRTGGDDRARDVRRPGNGRSGTRGRIVDAAVHTSSMGITRQQCNEGEQKHLSDAANGRHGDLVAILDQMCRGIVMTDREERVTFISESCRRLLGDLVNVVEAVPWTDVCPFLPEGRLALQSMAARLPDERTRVSVQARTAGDGRCHMEVSILDDPREPGGKILVFHDLVEIDDPGHLPDDRQDAYGLIGRSQAVQTIVRQIRDLSRVDATVLIEGETGTGKELVARAIHRLGPRSKRPFVPVNCAGLTESLIGSQLFGHKRGAFTGAVADHRGVFETAQGGTVFLDEIGDLPLSMQTNLLRVLQEKEITRVGESMPRRVDVRILAATHHDLDHLVVEGRFRQDLLYRIRVARISIPPLRGRRDDIVLLADAFMHEAAQRNNKSVTSLSEAVVRRILQHDWPGNVRELQSAIEFACIACRGSIIQLEDLPPELGLDQQPEPFASNNPEDAGAQLTAALQAAKGNRTAAARLLGISRATLYRRLAELPSASR